MARRERWTRRKIGPAPGQAMKRTPDNSPAGSTQGGSGEGWSSSAPSSAKAGRAASAETGGAAIGAIHVPGIGSAERRGSMDAVGGRDSPDTDNWRGSADAAEGLSAVASSEVVEGWTRRKIGPGQAMTRLPYSAPAAKAPQSPQAAAKIAELQAELEALKQSHSVVVNELNAKVNTLQESLSSTLQWVRVRVEALKQSHGVAVNELNGKVDALQTKNESLTSALQWAYAVEEIPRQHWLERGHDEDYADAMENLLSSMEESIKDLRMGTVSDSEFGENMIKIEFILQDEVENYIHADQDETLMPYWKELASALRHWSEYHADGKCLKVEIIYIELPKVVLDILRPAFEESRIENVFFENSHHTGDMADFAKKVLQSNHFITEVGFGEIKFSQETVKALCGAIKSRNAGGQFIKILALRNCFDGGIDTHTLEMILASITAVRQDAILNLNYNGMSSREAAVIARFLTSNPRLKQLEIDWNRFNDADVALLADALSSNTHLTNFSVCGNSEIKENGRLAFLRAVFDVTSLSSCASSNHTCRLRGLELDISAMNRKKKSILNKWSKIFAMLVLSSEDSFINTAILRGVPAQLIPLILDKCKKRFIHHDNHRLTDIYLELTNTKRCKKHDVWDSLGKRKPLNCMYDLLKSWVVPSIFV